MKKSGKVILGLGIFLLSQASASTLVESEYGSEGMKMGNSFSSKGSLLNQHDMDAYRLDSYTKRDPYTLEEESEEYMDDGNPLESAKAFVASAIMGNLNTKEYMMFTFGKSTKDLIGLLSSPEKCMEFLKVVAEDRVEKYKKMKSVEGMDPVLPSGKPKITGGVIN